MQRTGLFRVTLDEINDDGEQQTAKAGGYASESLDKVPVVRQHGFASHAPEGSHGIGFANSGERGQVALLGLEHADKRPRKLKQGNATLYDAGGNEIRMLGDDGIWHDAKDRPQKMTAKTIRLTGNQKVHLNVGGIDFIISPGRVDIGGEGGSRVMTESGPSAIVYAKV